MFLIGDIEATNLLNHESIDYTSSPYKLKDDFKIHCASMEDIETGKEYNFDPSNIDLLPELMDKADGFCFHNGIGYDYLAIRLYWGLDAYTISPDVGQRDVWNGKEKDIEDSLCLSKALNPDRYGGHSIDSYGKRFKFEKIDWRARAIALGLITKSCPKGAEFREYHPEMLTYCTRDKDVGKKTWLACKEEWGSWDWEPAYKLEKRVAENINRQEHRGFYFYQDRAEAAVIDLDSKMSEISKNIEPLIPEKPITKTAAKEFMFPAKAFKNDGSVSATMEKWLVKRPEAVPDFNEENLLVGVTWLGQYWKKMPKTENFDGGFPKGSVKKTLPATMADSSHIKEWLMDLGWRPSSYKEKDLTVKLAKIGGKNYKQKRTKEEWVKAVNTYVNQTLNSNYCTDRCDHLKVDSKNLKTKLLNHDLKKPLKVLTNPDILVGADKELCPGFEFVKGGFTGAESIAKWFTYRHRRNSILGGGVDWENIEEEAEKGYLSDGRIAVDGRIPTPADTMGAGSYRFTHRRVANIPRSSSLYGKELRALFGCDPSMLELGSDFNSMEAVLEGIYVYKYRGGPEYAQSLTRKKPNDFHTKFSKELTEMLGRTISRDTAKGGVKYGLTYGSQAERLAKSTGWTLSEAKRVYNLFWSRAEPLKLLQEKLTKYWETTGKRSFILGLDGRKIPTRAKHALLNNLFQSAGAICAKRQMVIFDQMLIDEGLSVDFFKDDWKNKIYVQQMIYYHDELQVEMHRSLAQFKVFDTEDEANSFKVQGKELGNVVKANGKYVVAYSIIGEMVMESAKLMSEHFKLPVELSMDYVVAKDWAGCH